MTDKATDWRPALLAEVRKLIAEADPEAVEDVLIEEMIRSAANKACVAIEATASADPNEHARWDRNGFRGTGPTIRRRVAPKGDPTGTTAPRGA